MPKRFIFKYKSGVEQKSLSFNDVAFFTSKKTSKDQKKVFILNLCDVALFTSTDKKWDQKIEYESYQLLLCRCKSRSYTQVFCCTFAPPVVRVANLALFLIFSQLNFIFSPDVFFSPEAENLALFLASLRLS